MRTDLNASTIHSVYPLQFTRAAIMPKNQSLRKRDAVRALMKMIHDRQLCVSVTELHIMRSLRPPSRVADLASRWCSLIRSWDAFAGPHSQPRLLGLAIRARDISSIRGHCLKRLGRYYARWCDVNLRQCDSKQSCSSPAYELEVELLPVSVRLPCPYIGSSRGRRSRTAILGVERWSFGISSC